jgi:hypothetical protein
MTNTTSNQALADRIERLVQEHITATRKSAQEALERAFAAAATTQPAKAPRQGPKTSGGGKRRAPAEVAALGERIYQAVCAKPGETMTVLAADVGASARELHRPMALLKQAGRVRSAGARHLTRYFPTTNGAAASA